MPLHINDALPIESGEELDVILIPQKDWPQDSTLEMRFTPLNRATYSLKLPYSMIEGLIMEATPAAKVLFSSKK